MYPLDRKALTRSLPGQQALLEFGMCPKLYLLGYSDDF